MSPKDIHLYIGLQIVYEHHSGVPKGVGPSTTLAWPGWKQPDIAVKVDRHDSKQAGSRKVM